MPDCVIDTTVVAYANGDLKGEKPGNILNRRLRVLRSVVNGEMRVRYNPKLLGEYVRSIKVHRNDVIEIFFIALESARAICVPRNTLSRQDYTLATKKCGWPSHDQHLIAAARLGDKTSLFVTEQAHATSASKIRTHFNVTVIRLA
jgi:hypothetical protein